MNILTAEQQAAWQGLFRTVAKARQKIDKALKDADLPALEVYDVLLELDRERAGDGLTAKQLELGILLPQYGVSRLLDRLETQGLVRRIRNPEDRRSRLICITSKGRALRQQVWPVYRNVIATFFDGRLDAEQTGQLADLLKHLRD